MVAESLMQIGVVTGSQNGTSESLYPALIQTWWFLPALVILFGLVMYVFYIKIRSRMIQEVENLRTRIARDLHDDIGSYLGGIAVNADHLSEKFSEDQSGFRRLQEMSNDARQMSDAIRDIIWFIDTERNSMDDLTERLRSITRSLLPKPIEATFSVKAENPSGIVLGMEQKRNLVLMFKEIVHNIMRHSGASKVEILIRQAGGRLEIQVGDNGNGFNLEGVRKGNGLVNLQRRAEDLRGGCSIRSTPSEGTTIVVSVPLAPGSQVRRDSKIP
jgi:signal transduction histidine kinase